MLVAHGGVFHALDKKTGKKIWSKELDSHPHAYIWGSPAIVDGIIIIGTGADGTRSDGKALAYDTVLKGLRGTVQGLDAATGKVLWVFDATGGNRFSDGNTVWSSCAIDKELGLCFIGVGNAWKEPIGPYNDGMVALDYKTGKPRWHMSYSPNDAWKGEDGFLGPDDSDVGATPNLFMIGSQKVVGVPDKAGNYTVHDRATGKVVWQRKNIRRPTVLGGFISSAAYADGKLFLGGNNLIFASKFYCLDATTGKTLWEVDNGSTFTIAAPAVSQNVVFSGDANGEIRAYSTENGRTLWTKKLPNGRGSDFTIIGNRLIVGFGFHFFDSTAPLGVTAPRPIRGGLAAFTLP